MKTKQKIALAGLAYHGISTFRRLLGRGDRIEVPRRGLRWELDLREGIDFSIYLFGFFEPGMVRFYNARMKVGETVLDIGANIGSHTLPFARCVSPTGHVIAFEPTAYAYEKLRKNLALNPETAANVTSEQLFLVSGPDVQPETELYSSWPLTTDRGQHPKHLGIGMSTQGAGAETLDAYLARTGVTHVDWIKLDVDGYEFSVLSGAEETLRRHRPKILMEFAPYHASEVGSGFDALIELLDSHSYRAISVDSGKGIELSASRIRHEVPDGSSINVFLEAKSG